MNYNKVHIPITDIFKIYGIAQLQEAIMGKRFCPGASYP